MHLLGISLKRFPFRALPSRLSAALFGRVLYINQMIPGLCRIWAASNVEDTGWIKMTYAPRSYRACEDIIENYQDRFGNLWTYTITADHDLCWWSLPERKVSSGN